jgi:undecaprenyl phosphate N,N'-diacetylbacillosamine 1-phosphate transferase
MSYANVKRFFDITVSSAGLAAISPLLLAVAAAIKLESKGPVIFKQDRLGMNGKVFKIYKFRSMCVDAEKGGVYEKKQDPRVTKVGKLIRKTSIDELPQFVNIIKGDMAIIGPRPTLTYHPWPLEKYTEEQKKRFNVRPGVTGLAQVNGRKDVPWDKRIEYDVAYVNKLSFFFDLKIFFKTILKVLTMKDNINVAETVTAGKDHSPEIQPEEKATETESEGT